MKEETEIRESDERELPSDMEGAEEADDRGASPSDGTQAQAAGDRGAEGVGSEVDDLRNELQTLSDKHLRLAAEFDNYRRRNERERQTLATRLQTELVATLLDVLDDLQRVAQSGTDAGAEAILEGVQLVEKKFSTVLDTAGLEAIDAEGERFDPEIMEALMTVPTDDSGLDDHVADVFQRGYRFRGTLVRPARVRVWQYDESGSDD